MSVPVGELIHLGAEPRGLGDEREPTLLDVVHSPAVRQSAARALDELETRHAHGPWVAVCTATSELIAASPSFDPTGPPEWKRHLDAGPRLASGAVPLVVLSLGERT